MRILLIAPPIEDFFFTPSRAYPLGLLYLATVLDSSGFKVKIINALAAAKKATVAMPQQFRYLKKYYSANKSPFCLFSNYYRFGLNDEDIAGEITKFKPQILGISSNFSAYFDNAYKVAKLAKEIDKNISVVFGGRFPTACPQFILGHTYVDFVLRGEAEHSLLKLCICLKEAKLVNIKGLCHKTKQKVFYSVPAVIDDLDTLPYPNRKLINYTFHKFGNLISTSLLTSRGCGLNCRFCAIKEKFRCRSSSQVLGEISQCYELGIRHFNFEDDNISLNPQFENLLDLLIEKFGGKIKISFMNGLMSQSLRPRLYEKLSNAGLTHLDLSLVSAKESLRVAAQRKEKKAKIFSFASAMLKHKIVTTVHYIIALPGQSSRDALEDLKFLARRRIYLGPSIFYPVIESSYFNDLKKNYSLNEKDYAFFRSSCAYFDKFMSRDQIYLIFCLSRIINFIKVLIDKFSPNEKKFSRFISERTKKFNLTANALSSAEKISRLDLGLIILEKLIKEQKIYKVRVAAKDGQFCYAFEVEPFVAPVLLKKFLSRLKISGVLSDSGFYFRRLKAKSS